MSHSEETLNLFFFFAKPRCGNLILTAAYLKNELLAIFLLRIDIHELLVTTIF